MITPAWTAADHEREDPTAGEEEKQPQTGALRQRAVLYVSGGAVRQRRRYTSEAALYISGAPSSGPDSPAQTTARGRGAIRQRRRYTSEAALYVSGGTVRQRRSVKWT